MSRRGVRGAEQEWPEGAREMAGRELPAASPGTQPTCDLLIQVRKGAPDSVPAYLSPTAVQCKRSHSPSRIAGWAAVKMPSGFSETRISLVFLKEERCSLLQWNDVDASWQRFKAPYPVLPSSLSSADTRTMYVCFDAFKAHLSVTERFHSLEGEVLANYRNCIKVFPKNISA